MSKTRDLNINWWNTEIGQAEKNALLSAFDGRQFTMGTNVRQAEDCLSKIFDIPYVVLTNSGSSGLLMSLLALGLEPGDEVIVPGLTWIATAQAAHLLGCKVIACDVEKDNPRISASQIEQLITVKTRAIIPVHLNGRYCDMASINDLASAHDIMVVEDCCKGMFSKKQGKFLGTFGNIGCFSMGMISPISIGYGGFAITSDEKLYQRLLRIRDHGVIRDPESYLQSGFNFKVSDLLASMAIPQLKDWQARCEKLRAIHDFYCENLNSSAVYIHPIEKNSGAVPVYVEAFSIDRERIIEGLSKKSVSVSRFHKSIDHARYFGPQPSACKNSRYIADNSFILPSGPSQKLSNIEAVVELLNTY